ncbi:hypothetical protein K439DRAFT_1659313 [Ramaria rubella]|nr:hypothetical protein K439DRAFT_1659313 [Ramaria rubella]
MTSRCRTRRIPVILALYLLHGPTAEFFSRLNGEFAFVIWDAQRQQLVAVRDRFGIKPLYWYYAADRLVFSSEIKAIASLRSVNRKFSTEWLDNLDPMFMTYWSPLPFLQSPNTSISYEDAKAEVRRLLTAAVKRRLVADRKVCVYLSGGVDSTVVCGIINQLKHPLTCVTIGFGDHAVSEESLATKTSQYYSLPHECVTVTLADTAKYAEKSFYHTEIPVFNPHAIAKFRLSEFAREKGFVVALTGEGSDEMFLGYSNFRSDLLLELRSKGGAEAERARKLASFLSREMATAITAPLPEDTPRVRGVPCWAAWHFNRPRLMVDDVRTPYASGHLLPTRSLDTFAPNAPEGLPTLRLSQVDWLTRLSNYVIPCMGERVEMAFSIEGRPPFLDTPFTEFALSLPQEYLLDSSTLREKKILYEAFDDILPAHIRTRVKHPFVSPPWIDAINETEEGRVLKGTYLSSEALERVGVFSAQKVHTFLESLRSGDEKRDVVLSIVISVQILHSLFIEHGVVGNPDFAMVDRSM